jgi:hypothetical protein
MVLISQADVRDKIQNVQDIRNTITLFASNVPGPLKPLEFATFSENLKTNVTYQSKWMMSWIP